MASDLTWPPKPVHQTETIKAQGKHSERSQPCPVPSCVRRPRKVRLHEL